MITLFRVKLYQLGMALVDKKFACNWLLQPTGVQLGTTPVRYSRMGAQDKSVNGVVFPLWSCHVRKPLCCQAWPFEGMRHYQVVQERSVFLPYFILFIYHSFFYRIIKSGTWNCNKRKEHLQVISNQTGGMQGEGDMPDIMVLVPGHGSLPGHNLTGIASQFAMHLGFTCAVNSVTHRSD